MTMGSAHMAMITLNTAIRQVIITIMTTSIMIMFTGKMLLSRKTLKVAANGILLSSVFPAAWCPVPPP